MNVRRKIPIAIRNQVAELAGHRCSYCRSPEWAGVPMVVDHIIPLAAGGSSDIENLCLSCYRCNEFKGARQEGIDPFTGSRVSLFKPRVQVWSAHFTWSKNGLRVIGLTACGRVTAETLHLNNPHLIQARQIWILVGLHPPLE
ncbi:MAG: HNH endonuclease [Desulfobacterales bacterium]|nr:HNH endonuclease [Desulfobacterales bacterium]